MAENSPNRWWKKYRIIKEHYRYEAWVKYIWWPWWFECYFTNGSSTLEEAEEIVWKHSRGLNKNTVKDWE